MARLTTVGARSALIVIGQRTIGPAGEPRPVKWLDPLIGRHVAGQDLGHEDQRRIGERLGGAGGEYPYAR